MYTAGRELDRYIAERIMGDDVYEYSKDTLYSVGYYPLQDGWGVYHDELPSYSTNPYDAQDLKERVYRASEQTIHALSWNPMNVCVEVLQLGDKAFFQPGNAYGKGYWQRRQAMEYNLSTVRHGPLCCDKCGEVIHNLLLGRNELGANFELGLLEPKIDRGYTKDGKVRVMYVRIVHNDWRCTSDATWMPIAEVLRNPQQEMYDTYDFTDCYNKWVVQAALAQAKGIMPSVSGVYLLHCNGRYKIGIGTDVARRVKQIQTNTPFEVEHIHTIPNATPAALERELHARFAAKRVRGEWFELDDSDVAYLLSL